MNFLFRTSIILALCGCAAYAWADLPVPDLALSFEQPEVVKRVFGESGEVVPGRQGRGVTNLRRYLGKDVAVQVMSAKAGTIMGWYQLKQKPGKTYQVRWMKLNDTQVGLSGTTDQSMLHGVKIDHAAPSIIEVDDWHHWAYVWENDRRRLYLDGQLIIDATQAPFPESPALIFISSEGEAQWVVDDFKIYRTALTGDEVLASRDCTVEKDHVRGLLPAEPGKIERVIESPDPCSVAYDERQLVDNPVLSRQHSAVSPEAIPRGWRVMRGRDQVAITNRVLLMESSADQSVAVLATLRRGQVTPGRAYRMGVYYKHPAGGGTLRLRFRNQIDMGSREFELPVTDGFERRFFFSIAPEDYDVGIYYLELVAEGAGTQVEVRAVYCREATADESASATLDVAPAPVTLSPSVVTDDRWIDTLPAGTRFMAAGDRTAAWGLEPAVDQAFEITVALKNEGASVWFENTPQSLWKSLERLCGEKPDCVPRLSVTRARNDVPGGSGLDPLPPRSAYGAALLFGIGAVDTGSGSYAFSRLRGLLKDFGYFKESTVFYPFWTQRGWYDWRYEHRNEPADYRSEFTGKEGAPLFGHTATGVLVSGYQADNRLLLVVVNTTDQELGKLGHLWVDHARLFGLNTKNTAGLMKAGKITAIDLETIARSDINWNREGGGYIGDVWHNLAIPPGDYRLVLVEFGGRKQ